MKPHFCAIANQQAGEDLIGTAGHYQTYVLVECPLPWAAKAFKSESIPSSLRQYIKVIKSERSVQFLAINKGVSTSKDARLTLMVYERTVPSDVAPLVNDSVESIKGYRGHEFQLDDLTQVVDCLTAHWQGDRIGQPITQQDILVCTHGMRDKCCARFGQPFFREATKSVRQGDLPNTRVWKVSHIGGHRFAPTAISLPDGRYYGQLTLSKLQAIVNRRGPIRQVRSVYRGWGLLPAPLQVLEQQLMQQYGWAWFDCKVTYRILADRTPAARISTDSATTQVRSDGSSEPVAFGPLGNGKHNREILVEITIDTEGSQLEGSDQAVTYRAKVTQDPQRTLCVKASCSSAIATPAIKYKVTECVVVASPQSEQQPAAMSKNA